MGVDWNTARGLIGARKHGVEFGRMATLGRQNLHVSTADLNELLNRYELSNDGSVSIKNEQPEYADALFTLLGASEIVPIDASNFEGATEVHDMNLPIPERLKQAFDVVLDGGTLEHVFNFPIAIKNVMEMVRVGGHLFIQTPANNNFGHGFYQFSPELFFRTLSPENGFSVERMLAYEAYRYGNWYEITDPNELGARVEMICNPHRISLFIQAKRTSDVRPFDRPPQQSDYTVLWTDTTKSSEQVNVAYGVRKKPSVLQRATWFLLRHLGDRGRRAAADQRARFLNRQLTLTGQPSVFRHVVD
jgi:SAM-dependent methyltransferase